MSDVKKFHLKNGYVLEVQGRESEVRIELKHGKEEFLTAMYLDLPSIPALMLALGEAAGYRDYVGSGDDLGLAVDNLDKHLSWVETQNAEAEAQAELEAEALELRNAFFAVERKNWDEVAGSGESKKDWLRAARKARELRAEK